MNSTECTFTDGPVLFNQSDPDEQFMAEVIQRFHSERPQTYRVMAMRRVNMLDAGKQQRLVLQAVWSLPQRKGGRAVWQVLVWDIDGPGVTFLRRPTRAEMLDLFRSI